MSCTLKSRLIRKNCVSIVSQWRRSKILLKWVNKMYLSSSFSLTCEISLLLRATSKLRNILTNFHILFPLFANSFISNEKKNSMDVFGRCRNIETKKGQEKSTLILFFRSKNGKVPFQGMRNCWNNFYPKPWRKEKKQERFGDFAPFFFFCLFVSCLFVFDAFTHFKTC